MAIKEFNTLQRKAAHLLTQGSATEALVHMWAAYRLSPTEPKLLFNLAAVEHKLGDADRSAMMFQRCVLIEPCFAPAYTRVIKARTQTDNLLEILIHLRRILCLVPL